MVILTSKCIIMGEIYYRTNVCEMPCLWSQQGRLSHRVKVTKLSNVDVIRECLIQGICIPKFAHKLRQIQRKQHKGYPNTITHFLRKNRQAKNMMKYGGWGCLNSTQMKWVVMLWHCKLRPYPSYGTHRGTVFLRCLQQACNKLFQKHYTQKLSVNI